MTHCNARCQVPWLSFRVLRVTCSRQGDVRNHVMSFRRRRSDKGSDKWDACHQNWFTQFLALKLVIYVYTYICMCTHIYVCRSQWPRGLRRRSAAARLLKSWVRIPPGAWMFVCCECCVLSGRGLCDELITRPEKSYRLWCVVVCDLETSRMRRPWPALDRSAIKKKKGGYKIWRILFLIYSWFMSLI